MELLDNDISAACEYIWLMKQDLFNRKPLRRGKTNRLKVFSDSFSAVKLMHLKSAPNFSNSYLRQFKAKIYQLLFVATYDTC